MKSRSKLSVILLLVSFVASIAWYTGLTNINFFKRYSDAAGSVPFTDEEIHRLENGFSDQVHPRLLEWISTHWIHPPSVRQLNLSHPEKKHFSQFGQSQAVDEMLHQKRNGFFVEVGANDGEHLSNSLFFERERNWTGLLIEAEKTLFQQLQAKHRKSFSINTCLNSKNTSGKVQLGVHGNFGYNALADEKLWTLKYKDNEFVPVQCFTLYSLMTALNRTKIDFFSLDVEGAELGVLKTIPFSKLDIDILVIEYAVFAGGVKESNKKFKKIDNFIRPKGYHLIKRVAVDVWYRKKRTN